MISASAGTIVGEVHRVEMDRRLLEVVEVGGRDVAKKEHGCRREGAATRSGSAQVVPDGSCRVGDQRANQLG